MISLKGITWDHSRGYLPLLATAQRYWEEHGVEITWSKRSLKEFGDFPLQKLVDKYDLLIIDHPFVGYAASHPILAPLDDYLPADYLQDQADNSVGKSHESYSYEGRQWALATDAATPVASYRPDLLKQHGMSLPRSWEELLELAKSGKVIVPAVPIDSLMNIYFLIVSRGRPLFEADTFAHEDDGIWALEQLKALVDLCPDECLRRNPIKTYDALSLSDDYVYCPFAYAYSNYSRRAYSKELLNVTDVVYVDGKNPGRTTLGGTGIAISAYCQHKEVAADYAKYVNSALIQKTLYVENGGQPGHRGAWLDETANALSNNFFKDALTTHDNAYLRPRYDGYLYFQDEGAIVVHQFLQGKTKAKETLDELQKIYALSLKGFDAIEASYG